MSDPILPLEVWEEGTLQNDVPANDNALRVEAMRRPVLGVENAPLTTDDGDVYIVGPAPSGDFATFDPDDLTIYRGGNWYAWAPVEGLDINGYVYTGSGGWAASGGGGGAVASVNGQTGVVVLDLDDLNDVSAPTPSDGQVLTWDSGTSAWQPETPAGGGMANPMTTAGDIIIGGASGTPGRLAVGTNAYVLTVVSGAPAWAAAGGGGLTNWTDALNSASPNATVPVASFTATNAATNVDAAIVAKGTGATSAQVSDGTTTGGNKRGSSSTDFQKIRASNAQVASGAASGIVAGRNNVVSGTNSFIGAGTTNAAAGGNSAICGGESNTASAGYAFVGAGYQCQATANYSAVVGGQTNTSTSTHCAVLGGFGNEAKATYGAIIGGQANEVTGSHGSVTGGRSNNASGQYSRVGGYSAIARGIIGVDAWAAGRLGFVGDAQIGRYHLISDTTNATPEALTADNGAAGTSNQVVLPNGSCYGFQGHVTVRQNATGDCKYVKFEGLIKRGASAAATALAASVTPIVVSEDAGASTWTVAVAADTTNGALAITVTGEASHTLKWSGFVETVEVVG